MLLGLVYFLIKTSIFYLVIIWSRLTFPRVRIDQLMNLNWKFMVPLSLILLMGMPLIDYATRLIDGQLLGYRWAADRGIDQNDLPLAGQFPRDADRHRHGPIALLLHLGRQHQRNGVRPRRARLGLGCLHLPPPPDFPRGGQAQRPTRHPAATYGVSICPGSPISLTGPSADSAAGSSVRASGSTRRIHGL